jgi:hypothetical protein
LQARIENNSWSDPGITSLNILFCAFNHSCEPNIDWRLDPADRSPSTIRLVAKRDIAAGEQLFVIYDQYLTEACLSNRRASMRHWLDADCRCVKCLREEAVLQNGSERKSKPDAIDWMSGDIQLSEAELVDQAAESQETGSTNVTQVDNQGIFW